MKSILISLLLASSFLVKDGVTVSGVKYAATYQVENNTLNLNGAGVRSKWFIDLYTTGLYLPSVSKNASEIVSCNCNQVIKIVIVSSLITTEKFNAAIDEALNKSMNNDLSSISKDLEKFKKALGTDLKSNDEFLFIYQPALGLKVFKNKKYKDTVKGLRFKQELLKIWLGEKCVNEDLKKGLLGT